MNWLNIALNVVFLAMNIGFLTLGEPSNPGLHFFGCGVHTTLLVVFSLRAVREPA